MNDINVCLRFFAAVAPGGCYVVHPSGPKVRGLRVTRSSRDIALTHDGATARSDSEMFETGTPTSISGIHTGEHR